MRRVVLPRVDYDAAHGDVVRCWVCLQRWPSPFDIVLDMHDKEVRIDGGKPLKLRPAQARALAVLVNCMPRWVSRSQLIESAFEDTPDVDMPSPSAITNALNECKSVLEGSRYRIENEKTGRGWRIVDEDTINREIREELAQIPKVSRAKDMAVLSLGAIKKTKGAPGKTSYRKNKNRHDLTKTISSKGAVAKFSKNNQYRRKRKTAEDV